MCLVILMEGCRGIGRGSFMIYSGVGKHESESDKKTVDNERTTIPRR